MSFLHPPACPLPILGYSLRQLNQRGEPLRCVGAGDDSTTQATTVRRGPRRHQGPHTGYDRSSPIRASRPSLERSTPLRSSTAPRPLFLEPTCPNSHLEAQPPWCTPDQPIPKARIDDSSYRTLAISSAFALAASLTKSSSLPPGAIVAPKRSPEPLGTRVFFATW
jgi:hypothetical protein